MLMKKYIKNDAIYEKRAAAIKMIEWWYRKRTEIKDEWIGHR